MDAQPLSLLADRPNLLALVSGELAQLGIAGVTPGDVAEHCLLVDDLGLDSLKFVDLTLRLEEALGVEEFPMQEWVDTRLDANEPLSVGALVDACAALLGQSPGARHV